VALIKSISGIRGTIGGEPDKNLTPLDVVKFTAAFGSWLMQQTELKSIVIGRDGRISGEMVSHLVANTLLALGFDVIDLGLSTTPTVELAVKMEGAAGGIIITASHNPQQWNALKLLNSEGEFISGEDGAEMLQKAESQDYTFASVDKLGTYRADDSYLQKHTDIVVNYPLTDVKAITKRKFKVVVDVVNSTGAIFVPHLLKALGVAEVIVLNGELNGRFAHNPEPLPENLVGLSNEVNRSGADFGIAVDPDVDRLCFVCDDGSMYGEEYTLVTIADYVLSKRKGNTVSNMSSTRALRDVTEQHGGTYHPSAVGEVNVVKKMKEVNAVIGGEGNGGIIVPDLHYGRDALIGIGLFLSHLAHHKGSISSLRQRYPNYFISKNKIELESSDDMDKMREQISAILKKIREKYKNNPANTEDGLKLEFDNDWVHLRASNTEPIIRIYAESDLETKANNIARQLMKDINECK
jgi:phosphomannomutase